MHIKKRPTLVGRFFCIWRVLLDGAESISLLLTNSKLHIELTYKFLISRGLYNHTDEVFRSIGVIGIGQHLSDAPCAFQLVGGEQQLFLSGAALCEVDGGEYPLFGQLSVEVNFHIARTLEFLEYNVVHAADRKSVV